MKRTRSQTSDRLSRQPTKGATPLRSKLTGAYTRSAMCSPSCCGRTMCRTGCILHPHLPLPRLRYPLPLTLLGCLLRLLLRVALLSRTAVLPSKLLHASEPSPPSRMWEARCCLGRREWYHPSQAFRRHD
eukprot:Rmarinus@m.5919